MLKLLSAILLFAAVASATVNPTVVPDASQNGVTVGPGWDDAAVRQLIRTEANVVYVIASDDDPCQIGTTSHGVIHAYKGSGAQAQNSLVPTSFAEVDAAHHPIATNAGSCVFTGNFPALGSPDIRYDTSTKTIHVLYTDSGTTTLYYQTFSTVTDTWSARVSLATNANGDSGNGWVRQNQVALTLDTNNIPHILYATSGTANTLRYANRIGGVWSAFTTVASGTNITHPSMVTALDGSIHAAWLSNALAAHALVQYSHYTGTWSAPETVDTGGLVLANGNGDQGPSVATDLSSLPHVLYLVGTVNSADDDVRVRYRTAGGVWTNNTPPSTAGGAPSATGTWFTHTPQNYISSVGDGYVVLGHDVNISPIVFEYQLGGIGNNWHAAVQADPRNQTNTTAGGAGIDGSASVRFDPLRDNNPSIIDVLYYDENDGTAGYDHHATLFYKAFVLATGTTRLVSTTGSNVGTCAVNPCLTITYAYGQAAAGDTVQVAPGTYNESLNLNKAGSSGNLITVQGYPVGGSCPTTPQTDAESPISTRTAPTVNINGATLAASFNTLDCFHLPTGININTGVNSSNVLNNYVDSLPNLTNVGVNFTLTFAGRPTNIHVSHNYIHATQYGMMIMADNSLFDFNEVDALTLPSSSVDDCDYNRLWGDSDTFRRNYYHGTTKGSTGTCKSTQAHNDGWQVFSDSTASTWFSRNMTFDGNTVDNFDEGFILSNDTSVANYFNTWTIVNNVIVNSTSWCGTFDSRDLHVIFMNNVCWGGNAQLRIIDDWDAFATATMQVSNNLFDGMSSFLNGSYFYSSTGGTLLAGSGHNIQRDIGFTLSSPANSVGDLNNVNPQLVSPSSTPGAGNYSIASTSPARGFATNVGLTTDHQGNPRPSGATGTGFDSGAYQFSTSAPTTFGISGIISSLSGNAATVTLSGSGAGSTTTDGSGNYSFSGLSNGTYTITPSRTGYTFSPASQNATVNSANITGLNFTATAMPAPVPSCSPSGGIYKSGRLISCTNAVSAATICWRIGSPPTTSNGTCTAGTTYIAPFMVSATGTLFVTGTQSGNTDSSTSYSFTINPTWTTGWIMNSPATGSTTFGSTLRTYAGLTSLAIATIPTPPNVGGIAGAGTIFTDPVYGTRGVRLTDACFDPSMAKVSATCPNSNGIADNGNNSYSGSQTGSADDLEFNTGDFLTIVANQGGRRYIVGFNPTTLAISRPYASATSGCAHDFPNCSNFGGWVTADGLDFSLKDPCKVFDTNNTAITSYTFGSDVVPWTNPCSGLIVGPPAPATVVELVEPSAKCLPLDFGTPVWTNSGGENIGDALLVRAFSSANYYRHPVWNATNVYSLNSQIKPLTNNPNHYTFVVTVAGTSGSTEPNWNLSCPALNNTCTDGTVTWKNQNVIANQGTGFYVVAYSPTKGCISYNTSTGAILADSANAPDGVGWQGGAGLTCDASGCSGTSTANAGAQFTIHNVKMNKSGNAISISPTYNLSGTGACQWQWIWVPGTTTVYCSQVNKASGHWVLGQKGMINDPGSPLYQFFYRLEPAAGPSGTPVAINTIPSSPVCSINSDQHSSYQSADVNDTWPFLSGRSNATIANSGLMPFDPPVCPWVNELVMVDMNGSGLSHRVAFTFNTGFSIFFNSQWGIPELSPSGRFASAGSDWLNNLRNAAGTAVCNGIASPTATCIPNGPAWKTAKVYALNYIINPTTTNAGNFSYRATVAGTSGASQPLWSTNCVTVGSTCSDNGITWTNVGSPAGVNAPGTDAFLWDLLSAR